MIADPISRRNFIANISATGALLSLTDTPLVQAHSTIATAATPQVFQAVSGPIKVLCTQGLSEEEIGQIRSAGNHVELLVLADSNLVFSGIVVLYRNGSF